MLTKPIHQALNLSILIIFVTSCGDEAKKKTTPAAASAPKVETASGDATDGAETLESCTEKGLAWLAVVENGAKPAACGEPLASFCCVQEEILARFPAKATDLAAIFARNIDADGFKLYHCSKSGAQTTTLHYGKIAAATGSVQYRTTTINRLAEIDTGRTGTCPTLVTTDLKTEEGGSAALTFAGDINPILKNTCAGAGCHGSGSSLEVYIDNETAFIAAKDRVIERLQLTAGQPGVMPPGGNISDDRKAKLIRFLSQ